MINWLIFHHPHWRCLQQCWKILFLMHECIPLHFQLWNGIPVSVPMHKIIPFITDDDFIFLTERNTWLPHTHSFTLRFLAFFFGRGFLPSYLGSGDMPQHWSAPHSSWECSPIPSHSLSLSPLNLEVRWGIKCQFHIWKEEKAEWV